MIKCVFKLDKKAKHYITREWVTNCHWAIRREALVVGKNSPLRKPLLALAAMEDGKYEAGFYVEGKVPDVNSIIPNLDGYEVAKPTGEAVFSPTTGCVTTVILDTANKVTAGMGPEYTPLLALGDEVLIKGTKYPIVIRKLGEIVCLVMPVRL